MREGSLLEIAKDRLRIPELWRLRGWPGNPGKSCHCPYRPDRSESGSIIPATDGRLFKDFASGETFDAPALLARVEDMSNEAACRLFIDLAGVTSADVENARWTSQPTSRQIAKHPTKPELPALEIGKDTELRALADLRAVSVEAVHLASARGQLLFADSIEGRAWVITDRERWNAIARRLDGKSWERLPSKPKARTLRGSWASWPIGLPESSKFPAIALVEGSPDALAAFDFAVAQKSSDDLGVVTMAGASMNIPEICLPAFANKRVRIFVHDDPAGRAAFARWASQLTGAGAVVDGFDFSGLLRADGAAVKDLNDLCLVGPASLEQWRELIDACMSFVPPPPATSVEAKTAALAAKLLTPSERETMRSAGFANDPLVLCAVQTFNARILPADAPMEED